MKIPIIFGAALTLAAVAFHSAMVRETAIKAESGSISGPFVLTNGCICQTVETGITNGGQITYTFSLTNSGSFAIQAAVNAPSSAANSFYVNIDAQPEDPCMLWDIPLTSGFESRLVSWRGNGTTDRNEFVPKYFDLSAGTHLIIIRGKEANAQLRSLSLLRRPNPPGGLHVVGVK